MAGTLSLSAVKNLHAAVKAWHLLNRLPWNIDAVQLGKVFDATRNLAPPAKDKRPPYSVDSLTKLLAKLDPNDSLDVAVYACACVLFWALARTGELTVSALRGFDKTSMVTPTQLSKQRDRQGNTVTVITLPKSKSSKGLPEDIICADQNGPTSAPAALKRQKRVNRPAKDEHLFTHQGPDGFRRPLSRGVFLARMRQAAIEAGEPILSGHSFRIGGTVEYLLRGVSLETVRTLGRWSSDSFLLYLCKHAQVLAPYIQVQPRLSGMLDHVLPPPR